MNYFNTPIDYQTPECHVFVVKLKKRMLEGSYGTESFSDEGEEELS